MQEKPGQEYRPDKGFSGAVRVCNAVTDRPIADGLVVEGHLRNSPEEALNDIPLLERQALALYNWQMWPTGVLCFRSIKIRGDLKQIYQG